MPKTINATVKTEAQKEANNPIFLVTLELSGGTIRLTSDNGNITFPTSGGSAYTGWGMSFGAIKSEISGGIDRVSIRFDNTNLVLSALVNLYSFPGSVVTIKRVFGNLLSSSSYSVTVFAGIMGAPVVNEKFVEVMAVSPMARLNKQAGRLYQNTCPWEYGGTECGDAGTSCNKTIAGCVLNDNVQRFGGFIYIPNRIL